ncbi:MAG: hypothetical protein IKU25_05920 [Clostridia bacterium]|nr:hypothetical protein [Clostridia bacterium]
MNILVIILYILGIVFDVLYINTDIFAFHVVYWIMIFLACVGVVVNAVLSYRKKKNVSSVEQFNSENTQIVDDEKTENTGDS